MNADHPYNLDHLDHPNQQEHVDHLEHFYHLDHLDSQVQPSTAQFRLEEAGTVLYRPVQSNTIQ